MKILGKIGKNIYSEIIKRIKFAEKGKNMSDLDAGKTKRFKACQESREWSSSRIPLGYRTTELILNKAEMNEKSSRQPAASNNGEKW